MIRTLGCLDAARLRDNIVSGRLRWRLFFLATAPTTQHDLHSRGNVAGLGATDSVTLLTVSSESRYRSTRVSLGEIARSPANAFKRKHRCVNG
jgi:hypothetical protein